MNRQFKHTAVFIGKSMLWSVLLYTAMMLGVYHHEVGNILKGRNAVAIITGTQPSPEEDAVVMKKQGVIKSIAAIVRTISGFASVAAGS